MVEKTAKREPFKKDLSENVQVLYGWKDGHAQVRARLPLPLKPWYSVDAAMGDLKTFKQTFGGALDFGAGKSSLALLNPIMIEVRDDCRVRWGFPDKHLELNLKRLGMWLRFDFTFEELRKAKEALDEASAWAELPQDVRDLQGLA